MVPSRAATVSWPLGFVPSHTPSHLTLQPSAVGILFIPIERRGRLRLASLDDLAKVTEPVSGRIRI